MMFVEAKWIYNYIISQEDIKSIDYKTLSTIIRKDKDKNDISTQIQHLGSSVKQELIAQVLNQIKGLSALKKKGYKVGKLRYKSEFNSIKLKQYKVTHYLKGNNKIKVQGIHDGLKQLIDACNIPPDKAKLLNISEFDTKLMYDNYLLVYFKFEER